MNARVSPDSQMHILIAACTNDDTLIQTITFVFTSYLNKILHINAILNSADTD